ncbi:22623_t:CDS:2 [Gigaspora rosea]|nr:22623_t:CDS:2 [Gigaspora rosea]
MTRYLRLFGLGNLLKNSKFGYPDSESGQLDSKLGRFLSGGCK